MAQADLPFADKRAAERKPAPGAASAAASASAAVSAANTPSNAPPLRAHINLDRFMDPKFFSAVAYKR
jgi:hypothetical protein